MNPRPIEEAGTVLRSLALPALERARQRAEEIARSTRTGLVLVQEGRIVVFRPGDGVSTGVDRA